MMAFTYERLENIVEKEETGFTSIFSYPQCFVTINSSSPQCFLKAFSFPKACENLEFVVPLVVW